MKAHVIRSTRALLLWNFGPACPGWAAVERLARAYRLAVHTVGPADLGATVADLCDGRPGRALDSVPAGLPGDGAAIISGLGAETGDLNAFVDALKATGAALPIRAAVTPTSRGWTLAHLLAELDQEHTALGDGT